jgi:hypothetical protein
LVSGVKALVNDPNFDGLAQQLFAHAAVNPRGPGPSDPLKNSPSYIDATQFARALLDISGLSATSATAAAQAPGPQAIAALQANVNGVADPQIKQLLQGVINRCSGDIQQIETELASWFDAAMDRISGDFKRWTQLATFIIALVVAFVINLDSVRVATLLWEQPMLADRLKASSQLPVTAGAGDPKTEQAAEADLKAMLEAGLPVGWAPGHFMEASDKDGNWKPLWPLENDNNSNLGFANTLRCVLGWLITAFAALFGAPFWFDALQTVIRLKGSGPSPDEKAKGQAAAN